MRVGLDVLLLLVVKEAEILAEVGVAHPDRAGHRERDHDSRGRETPQIDLASREHDVLEELGCRDGVAGAGVAGRSVRDRELDDDPDEERRRAAPEEGAPTKLREAVAQTAT